MFFKEDNVFRFEVEKYVDYVIKRSSQQKFNTAERLTMSGVVVLLVATNVRSTNSMRKIGPCSCYLDMILWCHQSKYI